MTFFNNRSIIVDAYREGLYVFIHMKNKLFMNFYSGENLIKEIIVADDISAEFDVLIRDNGEVYCLYESIGYDLKYIIIKKGKIIKRERLGDKRAKIYELNIVNTNKDINLFYLKKSSDYMGNIEIWHGLLNNNNKLKEQEIVKTGANNIINPIRVLKTDRKILIGYYNENKICIKSYDVGSKEWEDTQVLSDTIQDKLYLNMVKEDNYLHIVYSQYKNENLIIKYIRFLYHNDSIEKDIEKIISNESNATHPLLIIQSGLLWIIWKESINIYSRYSMDGGNSWSSIYIWKDSKRKDYLLYKYISNSIKEGINLDHTFGTFYPDIKFIGFGELENVDKVAQK